MLWTPVLARLVGLGRKPVSAANPLPIGVYDPAGGTLVDPAAPVKTIGSHSGTPTITATGIGVAVPCTVVRIIVDDVGTAGTVQINDNAAAAAGAAYGPHKLIAGQVMEYGIHMAAGAFVTLTGSAKVTLVYKADP